MPTRYSHTNIVARDPEGLAAFYSEVLQCRRVAERHIGGPWLGRAMGLPGAALHVIHVLLPGCGEDGPTLEIFGMEGLPDAPRMVPRSPGLMHTAFAVDDIRGTLARLLSAGGETLGEIAAADVDGVGHVEFVYTRDPEGNIVELQELA
jgi:catechol 2,3-dioxygenase-like lactoylglutathione lyase family enzyme